MTIMEFAKKYQSLRKAVRLYAVGGMSPEEEWAFEVALRGASNELRSIVFAIMNISL